MRDGNASATPLDTIAKTVTTWRVTRCHAARLKATADAAERRILEALGDAEVGTVNGEPVVRRETLERQTFRFADFRERHPDLVDKYVYRRQRDTLKLPDKSTPDSSRDED